MIYEICIVIIFISVVLYMQSIRDHPVEHHHSEDLRGLDSSSELVFSHHKDISQQQVSIHENKLALLFKEEVFHTKFKEGKYNQIIFSDSGFLAFGSLDIVDDIQHVKLAIPLQTPNYMHLVKKSNPNWISQDGSTTIANGNGWIGLQYNNEYLSGCKGCGTSLVFKPVALVLPDTFSLTVQTSSSTSVRTTHQSAKYTKTLTVNNIDFTIEPIQKNWKLSGLASLTASRKQGVLACTPTFIVVAWADLHTREVSVGVCMRQQ